MESRPSLRIVSVLLVLALGACAGGRSRTGALEPRDLRPDEVEALDRLARLWVASPAEYRSEKLQLMMKEPRLAPWLVKSLTAEAVKAYDHMVAQNVVVRQFLATPQAEKSFFGRTRAELASFGDTGREAVFTYLMRDDRAQLREVGLLLLVDQPAAELYPSLQAEWDVGDPRSRRTILELSAERAADAGALALIERGLRDPSWQLRGAAQRPWVAAARAQGIAGAGDMLWRRFEAESDPFVRRQCLLALGDLGDSAWLRPLVDLLESLEQGGRTEEAASCVQALEALTRERPGPRAADWKRWLRG